MLKRASLFLMGLLTFVVAIVLVAQGEVHFGLSGNLEVITVDNAESITMLVNLEEDVRDISFSPDGMMMAIVTQDLDLDYNISILDTQSGAETSHMQGRMDSFRDLVWSPDSQRIAVISGRTTGAGVEERSVKTYTLERGTNINYYILGHSDTWYTDYVDASPEIAGNPVEIAWNPSSNMIAIAFYNKLEIYDLDSDSSVFSTPIVGIESVRWSPNGTMIVTSSDGDIEHIWGIASN